jgi:hypothetical protein
MVGLQNFLHSFYDAFTDIHILMRLPIYVALGATPWLIDHPIFEKKRYFLIALVAFIILI